MHFFGMIFWLVILWFVFRALRHRERWAMMGPRGYVPWWYSGRWGGRGIDVKYGQTEDAYGSRGGEVRDQQAYIDSLETRVSELEERLDFTERLLAGRQQPETDK